MITITYLKKKNGKSIRGLEALESVKDALTKAGFRAKVVWQ